jgi:hypothetical protein
MRAASPIRVDGRNIKTPGLPNNPIRPKLSAGANTFLNKTRRKGIFAPIENALVVAKKVCT